MTQSINYSKRFFLQLDDNLLNSLNNLQRRVFLLRNQIKI